MLKQSNVNIKEKNDKLYKVSSNQRKLKKKLKKLYKNKNKENALIETHNNLKDSNQITSDSINNNNNNNSNNYTNYLIEKYKKKSSCILNNNKRKANENEYNLLAQNTNISGNNIDSKKDIINLKQNKKYSNSNHHNSGCLCNHSKKNTMFRGKIINIIKLIYYNMIEL